MLDVRRFLFFLMTLAASRQAAGLNPKLINPKYIKEPTMCEANVFLLEGDDQKLIMEAVDTVEPEEDGVRISNIFGEQKFIRAQIYSLSLVENKVFLRQNE